MARTTAETLGLFTMRNLAVTNANPTKMGAIIGIDIGTSKISAVIAEIEKRQPEYLGFCSVPFDGKGWDSKEAMANSLTSAISEVLNILEQECCRPIPQLAVIGMSGKCLTENVMGSVAINECISELDVRHAIERATTASQIPEGMAVLDNEVTSFMVDDQDGIPDPLGMVGNRLGVRLTTLCTRRKNIEIVSAACNRNKLEMYTTTASSLASATAILSEDELKNGVCVLDMGARISTMVVYSAGGLDYIVSVPWGGNILTESIGKRLRVEKFKAEQLKIAFSNGEDGLDADRSLMIRDEVDKWSQRLCKLLERELDIHYWIHKAQDKFNLNSAGGIVLTGGSGSLPGLQEILTEVFRLPVRQGCIQSLKGVNGIPSEYASAVGLVMRGIKQLGAPINIS